MAKRLIDKLKNKLKMTGDETQDIQNDNDQTEVQSEEEVKKPKKRSRKGSGNSEKIDALEAELAESKDKHLRLFAEFENFKKRTMRERMELFKTAGQDTVNKILPVLDDFDRAKKSAEDESTDEQLSEGILMVYNKLYSVMSTLGVEAMETNGEAFDPEVHEAITEIPAPSEDMKGKIIDTVEKGYMMKDKIIRFAKVVVGK